MGPPRGGENTEEAESSEDSRREVADRVVRTKERQRGYASAYSLQPSRGQQLYRAVPSQLERSGGVVQTNTRTSSRPSAVLPAGSRSTITTVRIADSGAGPRTNPVLSSSPDHLFKHGPLCLVCRVHYRCRHRKCLASVLIVDCVDRSRTRMDLRSISTAETPSKFSETCNIRVMYRVFFWLFAGSQM